MNTEHQILHEAKLVHASFKGSKAFAAIQAWLEYRKGCLQDALAAAQSDVHCSDKACNLLAGRLRTTEEVLGELVSGQAITDGMRLLAIDAQESSE